MAHVVFLWEQGEGLGHLVHFVSVIDSLLDDGHEVTFITRELPSAHAVFADRKVRLVQAPLRHQRLLTHIEQPATYAELFLNMGLGDQDILQSLVDTWRDLFNALRPDLFVIDHSPTAVVAARAVAIPKIMAGNGFMIPPLKEPLPQLRYWDPVPRKRNEDVEAHLVKTINGLRGFEHLPTLSSLRELFTGDAEWLFTFRETDHHPERGKRRYMGLFPNAGFGDPIEWNPDATVKVFGYLHPFPTIDVVLQHLRLAPSTDTQLYAPEVDKAIRKRYEGPNLRFLDRPAALNTVGDATFAMTVGNPATSVAALLEGCPVVLFPFTLERHMFCRRIHTLGAGVLASVRDPKNMVSALEAVKTPDYRRGAQKFAKKYKKYTAAEQLAAMQSDLEKLLPT